MRKITVFFAASVALFVQTQSAAAQTGPFESFIDINQAQLIMLDEAELLERDLSQALAVELLALQASQGASISQSTNYLDLEAELVRRIGPAASNLHIGRSRNDIGAALSRLVLRERVAESITKIGEVRAALLRLAQVHETTIIPGYTHGVQAQPTVLAHYLLALDAHLQRDTDRLLETLVRIDQSPLGTAALTGSSYPINRQRLTDLLGFERPVANTYDAIIVSTGDMKVEIAQNLSLSALGIGRFAQDILWQYDAPAPGLYLGDGVTGRSSIMPQKRNPRLVEQLRVAASQVTSGSTRLTFMVHNTPFHEVRDTRLPLTDETLRMLDEADLMYELLLQLLNELEVSPDRLRARVDEDYAVMSEVADTLFRDHGVPFRQGYAFASALTTYGRENGLTPNQIDFADVEKVYQDITKQIFPMRENAFRMAIDPQHMVQSRQTSGGPQRGSIRLLHAQSEKHLDDTAERIAAYRRKWSDARAELDYQTALLAETP